MNGSRREAASPIGAALVAGAGIGGMQAALDLAAGGFKVYLIDPAPAIGGHMPQLDKTFPTNDCSMCTLSPRLAEVEQHRNIELITGAKLTGLRGTPGHFQAVIRRAAQYIDTSKCNACGDCAAACPVQLPNEFDVGLGQRRAAFKLYPQAIPNAFAISKTDRPPCQRACPASVNTQGYVALIAAGKYAEALALIRERQPFASACGRICHHPCESHCNRQDGGDPVAIMALKRLAADRARTDNLPPLPPPHRPEAIAVVGAGPAGLTAARELRKQGFPVTLYDAARQAGGALRSLLPRYRLPLEALDADIAYLLGHGFTCKFGTVIGEDLTVDELLSNGYRAVIIATGAHHPISLPAPGGQLPQVIPALDILRAVNNGGRPVLGREVAVIGGGNVALDAARTALRLGAKHVRLVCLERQQQMPSHPWEIDDALEEGIELLAGWGIAEITPARSGVVLRLHACQSLTDSQGRFAPQLDPARQQRISADTVLTAIGSRSRLTALRGSRWEHQAVPDPALRCSNLGEGVFLCGDALRGPTSAVEAAASGHETAAAVRNWLDGVSAPTATAIDQPTAPAPPRVRKPPRRVPIPRRPPSDRICDFGEVDLPLAEHLAQQEAQRCLNCGLCSMCGECVNACGAGAINHEARPQNIELEIGAVVLAPGFELYDPQRNAEYGYGRFPNVVTNIEFERMLSASGPTDGHVRRPSDGRKPRTIAWLQCVGSRDDAHGHKYCSSVCCMAAVKEAAMAREHDPEVNVSIFYNDLRAHGKGFQAYADRAERQGIRFIQGLAGAVREHPQTRNLLINRRTDTGDVIEDQFDLVVLSTGMSPAADLRSLAQLLGVELNESGFIAAPPFNPGATSRSGIYACGTANGPMDIPETVMSASCAASLAAQLLAPARGTKVALPCYPPERDVQGQPPRIGVFVCHCGTNIARTVNVAAVAEAARSLPHVVHAEDNLYTCSTDTMRRIRNLVQELDLNRVVVTSCSPRTHEPLFQEMIREAGLNRHLFAMANIRDQCSWVHARDPSAATEKAKSLMRMTVSRARLLAPLAEISIPVSPAALVIGGGGAGLCSARALLREGYDVHVVEKDQEFGGHLRQLTQTMSGHSPGGFLDAVLSELRASGRVHLHQRTAVIAHTGSVGSYLTTLRNEHGEEWEIKHGVVVVATGGREAPVVGFGYGESPRVILASEFERRLAGSGGQLADISSAAVILCAGSLNAERPYCSRICCSQSVKNVLRLRERLPAARISVYHRGIRTYGLDELAYLNARQAGIRFLRYDPARPPSVALEHQTPSVLFHDPLSGLSFRDPVDTVILATGIVPEPGAQEIAHHLHLPATPDGFFQEAHVKLRPLDFANEGMYLCGLAHGPKQAEESIAQAIGTAARASAILSRELLALPPNIAVVDSERCAACLTCVRLCPYHVPRINADGVAEIDPAQCHGCGSCASGCPAKAIHVQHHRDDQFLAQCEAWR